MEIFIHVIIDGAFREIPLGDHFTVSIPRTGEMVIIFQNKKEASKGDNGKVYMFDITQVIHEHTSNKITLSAKRAFKS